MVERILFVKVRVECSNRSGINLNIITRSSNSYYKKTFKGSLALVKAALDKGLSSVRATKESSIIIKKVSQGIYGDKLKSY